MYKINELEQNLLNIDENESIDTLLELSDLYTKSFAYDQASIHLKKALAIAEAISDESHFAKCTWKLGMNYWFQNDFQKAQKYFIKAIPLCEILGNRLMVARLRMAVGVTHWNLGDSGRAIEMLRKAISTMLLLREKNYLRSAYNWIGIAYSSIDDFQKALKYYIKGLAIQEEMNDKAGIANAKNSIGILHLDLKNYNDAINLLQDSLKIREQLDDKEGIADSLNNLGMVYHQTDIHIALDYYTRSLKIRRKIGGKAKMANTLSNIGNIQADLKNLSDAIKSHRSVLKIREEIGDKAGILHSTQNLASSLIKNNELTESKILLDNAIKFQTAKSALKHDYKTYEILSLYYKKTNEFQKALEYYEKYTEMKLKICTEETAEKIIDLQTKYELEKQQKENRIYQLKNKELHTTYETISTQHEKLKSQSEHLHLVSRILRHDITNNLSVIYSAMRLYKNDKSEKYLQEIPIQIEKSFELIKKLSKITYLIKHEHHIETVDVNDILNKLVNTYRNIEFEIEGQARVEADFLLESVFDNLISNAQIHGKTDRIKIIIKPENEFVNIDFIDYGNGIPDNYKDKIFDESFMYGASGNTGLGLFIVKKAIENFGGSVNVCDNKPNGTIFTLKLKKAEE